LNWFGLSKAVFLEDHMSIFEKTTSVLAAIFRNTTVIGCVSDETLVVFMACDHVWTGRTHTSQPPTRTHHQSIRHRKWRPPPPSFLRQSQPAAAAGNAVKKALTPEEVMLKSKLQCVSRLSPF
jgi:hypothetical protein